MDNVNINTKHQPFKNKANGINVKTEISLAQYTMESTSTAQFGMPLCSLRIWGMQVGPHTRYGLVSWANQLNSE